MEEFLRDTEEVPTNTELGEISSLALLQVDLEAKVQQIEEELSHAHAELRHVQEVLLPNAMAAVGMTKFTLNDGSTITVKDDVHASIRANQLMGAIGWLTDVGLGDIVKNDVTVKFGRGERDRAKDIVSYAQAQGYNVNEKMSVHPGTLKATVKEQLAKGVEFPESFFSVHPVKKSIIK